MADEPDAETAAAPTDAAGTAAETEAEADPSPPAEPAAEGKVKLTKAERLEAKAARLREADERRAAERAAAEDASAEAGPAAPRSSGWTIAVIVLSVVTAGLLTLSIIGFISWQHQRDLNSARADVTKVAKRYAVDFASYNYQHLDADFKKVASELTPAFARKSYTPQTASLKPTLIAYKGKSTATVQGIGVTSVSESKATVVIFLDQTVTNSQSSTPRIDRNRLQMSLVKSHGKWLITKLSTK